MSVYLAMIQWSSILCFITFSLAKHSPVYFKRRTLLAGLLCSFLSHGICQRLALGYLLIFLLHYGCSGAEDEAMPSSLCFLFWGSKSLYVQGSSGNYLTLLCLNAINGISMDDKFIFALQIIEGKCKLEMNLVRQSFAVKQLSFSFST